MAYHEEDEIYDKELMRRMADSIEEYVNMVDKYVIIPGVSAERYEEAKKTVKKLIKHLRKGRGSKVMDEERYQEVVARMETAGSWGGDV